MSLTYFSILRSSLSSTFHLSSTMESYEAAKEAVLRISKKFGHLDQKVLDKLEQFDPAVRREVEESLLAKDQLAGNAIIT